jgi:hypothetical protein
MYSLLTRAFGSFCILSFWIAGNTFGEKETYSGSGARKRFEANFNNTCSKYPFVVQYIANLEAPSERYVVFVFHETGSNNGGLGDRLGGMVSAVAFALRTGRTLLISGDKAFNEAFQPYHPRNESRYQWGDWNWSGWKKEYSQNSNMTYLKNCVNPKPSARICQLDNDMPHKVVKLRSNRAFLCRWVVKPKIYQKSNLARLGISGDTDLFEAAGCMLRLAMWPTEKLWNALDKSLESQMLSRPSMDTSYQVGFHFRCGDKSFSNEKGGLKNPECFFDPAIPWTGTNFMDDKSLDSPVDAANCGRKILDSLSPALQKDAMVYIASDNADSAQQINSTIKWPFVILPPKACHIDLKASLDCSLTTSLHWFMLSLSNNIVMQGLIQPVSGSMFEDLPSEDGRSVLLKQQGSISGFSRFAGIYALNSDVSRYGLTCNPANRHAVSRQTQGNWLCDPKQLY